MPNPIVNPVILVSPVEEGYVAYDPKADMLHRLNPFAALLLELCDGTRSADDIRALTTPLMAPDTIDEVDKWIEQGVKTGLLLWHGSESERSREFTAKELADVSKHLGSTGRIQGAFLCAKRVVALSPGDMDSWYRLGDLALNIGRRKDALEAYQTYFGAHPEDAEIEHLLVALRDEAPPPRTSDRAIAQIYKGFAPTYEARMVDDLRYQGPQRLREVLVEAIGEKRGLEIADIGCGSGLAGMMLKEFASNLIGVDLSPEMIELARARNIYDKLEVAEITGWLESAAKPFDIVASCDCLIYFGDLTQIARAALGRLRPGGVFVFSTERGPTYPFRLTDTGRYEHHPDHVRDVAAAVGMKVVRIDEKFLRMEYGSEVIAIYAALKKEGSAKPN